MLSYTDNEFLFIYIVSVYNLNKNEEEKSKITIIIFMKINKYAYLEYPQQQRSVG